MGLREVAGNDPVNPATDSFSLGNGTPQVWGPEMAAGTAFVEIRRTDQLVSSPPPPTSTRCRCRFHRGSPAGPGTRAATAARSPG